MNHIWKTLPDDIIVQHIMPYLYQKQSPILLADIRNYMEYYYTNEFYNYDYNQYVWFSDLINFFTVSNRHSTKSVRKLLKRHIIYKNKNDFELFDVSFDLCYKNIEQDIERKIRFVWGLMLPVERTRFINKILLE